jgi:hypothetical protein
MSANIEVRRDDSQRCTFTTKGGGWGRHVEWGPGDYKPDENGTVGVWGHMPHEPQPGDLLIATMTSGTDGVFRFVSVERCADPPDMFFGRVEPVGYVTDDAAKDALAEANARPRGWDSDFV